MWPDMACVVQGLKHMALNEGLRGMFRGNWTNCLRIIPNSAIKFLTYEQLTRCAPSSCMCASQVRVKAMHVLLMCGSAVARQSLTPAKAFSVSPKHVHIEERQPGCHEIRLS